MYSGGSGGDSPVPWSVNTANCNPTRAAAAATSLFPSAPSDRVVWMWNAPRTVGASDRAGAGAVLRGARGPVAKTMTAAIRAAVIISVSFLMRTLTADTGRTAVGSFVLVQVSDASV